MRKLAFSLLLAAAGAIGLAGSTPAQASHDDRIFVGIGDVMFSYGRPYYRYDNTPLYVVYERGYPRYYRYVGPRYSSYYPPPPRYVYAPPPPWRGYGPRYRPRHDWRWDHDRRWDRDGRRHDRRGH